MTSAPTKDINIFATGSICTASPSSFEIVRHYLEQFNDLSILADVVGIAATSFDSLVLSASADTLCYHYKAFKAIGAFNPLFEKIVMRYTAIRAMRLPERNLLLSITALSNLTPADPHLVQLLDYDLGRYDQRNSLAVCSPVSDTMIESSSGTDPEDEIERILSSGNSMDHLTMSRVFAKIISYLEQCFCQDGCPTENVLTWFCRLQNLEENTFHTILASWLSSILTNEQSRLLGIALPPLVVSGCFSLPRLTKTVRECMRRLHPNHPSESLRAAVNGLDAILPQEKFEESLLQQHLYQFRTRQFVFCQKRDSGLLDLIKESFDLIALVPEAQSERSLPRILSSGRLLGVLRHFTMIDLQSVSFLLKIPARSSQPCVKSLVDRIMDPLNALGKVI